VRRHRRPRLEVEPVDRMPGPALEEDLPRQRGGDVALEVRAVAACAVERVGLLAAFGLQLTVGVAGGERVAGFGAGDAGGGVGLLGGVGIVHRFRVVHLAFDLDPLVRLLRDRRDLGHRNGRILRHVAGARQLVEHEGESAGLAGAEGDRRHRGLVAAGGGDDVDPRHEAAQLLAAGRPADEAAGTDDVDRHVGGLRLDVEPGASAFRALGLGLVGGFRVGLLGLGLGVGVGVVFVEGHVLHGLLVGFEFVVAGGVVGLLEEVGDDVGVGVVVEGSGVVLGHLGAGVVEEGPDGVVAGVEGVGGEWRVALQVVAVAGGAVLGVGVRAALRLLFGEPGFVGVRRSSRRRRSLRRSRRCRRSSPRRWCRRARPARRLRWPPHRRPRPPHRCRPRRRRRRGLRRGACLAWLARRLRVRRRRRGSRPLGGGGR
jgi:hypothetical protein